MATVLPEGTYNIQPGLFGLTRYQRTTFAGMKPVYVEWYQCRDSFQYAWRRHCKHSWLDDTFFFCCKKKHLEAFLDSAEKKLGLWKKTKVFTTNVKGVCSIRPAEFWLKQEIRMSLFTILLRASENYRIGTDWKECLYTHPYAEETKDAIEYFFDGHTVFQEKIDERVDGWCYAFNPMYKKQEYKQLLRRPTVFSFGRWLKSWFVKP